MKNSRRSRENPAIKKKRSRRRCAGDCAMSKWVMTMNTVYMEADRLSNEELCILIQAGKTELLGELWEQAEGVVKWKANRVMTGNMRGVTFADLHQSGYVAMVEAVGYFTPDNGAAFSTCLLNRLRTVFAEITGYRTKSGQNEPLNNSLSLDRPVDDEGDGATFGEFVADPAATAQLQTMEEKIWHKQLQEAMETALSALPERCAEVLRMRYYQGLTLSEIGQSKNCSLEMVRQIERKGIRLLQQPKNACNLLPFYQYDFYAKTGLAAFRASGLSVQERYLLDSEARQERAELRQKAQNEKKYKKQFDEMMEQIDKEVAEQVSRMTEEEKAQLLAKYGA
mgnify:CR=1 FL=1